MDVTDLFDLTHKVAIVTGGGNGIGKASCLMLAKAVASIAVSDLKLADAQAVADEINESGGKAIAVECNVTEDAHLVNLVERTVKELGGLHILVNNAGGGGGGAKTRLRLMLSGLLGSFNSTFSAPGGCLNCVPRIWNVVATVRSLILLRWVPSTKAPT